MRVPLCRTSCVWCARTKIASSVPTEARLRLVGPSTMQISSLSSVTWCLIFFMNRPCFLVIDREFPGSISTRKLVIETAKFNVLTAYSGKEALEIFKKFPAVGGVVLDGGLDDISCS